MIVVGVPFKQPKWGAMPANGTKRRFAAALYSGRYRGEADMRIIREWCVWTHQGHRPASYVAGEKPVPLYQSTRLDRYDAAS
jgi:hypothetical protein